MDIEELFTYVNTWWVEQQFYWSRGNHQRRDPSLFRYV